MSIISNAYNALNTFLDTHFDPNGTILTNPYDAEDNADIVLKRGYGFYIGAATDQGTMTNELEVNRDVVITLTIETGSSQHKNDKRFEAEKLLLEDHFKLISELHKDPGLGGVVSAIAYQGDNGFEFIFGEKTNFLKIMTRFQMTYIESIGV